NRDDRDPARSQDAMHLADDGLRVENMLEDFGAVDAIERGVAERECHRVAAHEACASAEASARLAQDERGQIDAELHATDALEHVSRHRRPPPARARTASHREGGGWRGPAAVRW